MISYGSRIADLKKDAVKYITEKVKSCGLYRNKPGDMEIRGERCFIIHTDGTGTIPLDGLSLERIGEIADKAYFKPVRYAVEGVVRKSTQSSNSSSEKQKSSSFEIKKDVSAPVSSAQVEKKKAKYFNYRSLPLKAMQVGDHIVIFDDCTEDNISRKISMARAGVNSFVSLMDTDKKFYVDRIGNNQVAVWRLT